MSETTEVPTDFPVKVLSPEQVATAKDPATCGTCQRTWDDAVPTSRTPAPSGRCPFEAWHDEPINWPTALDLYTHWAQHSTSPTSYVELLPLGPTDSADTGGECQVDKAWDRRFVRRAPDAAEWLMVTVALYVADPTLNEDEPLEHVITRQTEYLRCTDLSDPGGTEVYGDYTFEVVATDPTEVTEENAKALCARVSAAEFTWYGLPIVHGATA